MGYSLVEALLPIRTGFLFQNKKLQDLSNIILYLKYLSRTYAIKRTTKDIGYGKY